MSVDVVVPLLGSLFDLGAQFQGTAKGLESDAHVHQLLQGQAGGSVTEFRDVETIISAGSRFSTTDPPRYIRLQDIEEGGTRMTPLVYLDGNLKGASPYLRLQVVLVIHANNLTQTGRKIALRFETPEQSGKHAYYHSQICVNIQKGSGTTTIDMEMEPIWFPTSHPAWPLDAETPTELLICLILALYGKVVGAQIIRDAGVRSGLDLFDSALDAMRTKFRNPPVTVQSKKASKRLKRRK